jgi:hypothetical protein
MSGSEELSAPMFKKGDTVRLKRATAEKGVIVAEPRLINGKYSYRVNMAGRTRNFGEDDLELCSATGDPRELFIEGSFGDRESCLLYLTYLRITGSLTNYVYSFYNSRTEFYVYQFTPLIKFLAWIIQHNSCDVQVRRPPRLWARTRVLSPLYQLRRPFHFGNPRIAVNNPG